MGVDAEERAFIEMADRQVELTLLAAVANHVRHTHPGLLPLENPQFADYAAEQGKRMVAAATLDAPLAQRPWMAGATGSRSRTSPRSAASEFARLRNLSADAGLQHLANWRERVAERPSARL